MAFIRVLDIEKRPVIGAGCCVIPARQAIAEAIADVSGVIGIQPTEREDEMKIEIDPGLSGSAVTAASQGVLETVRGLGYEAEMTDSPARAPLERSPDGLRGAAPERPDSTDVGR